MGSLTPVHSELNTSLPHHYHHYHTTMSMFSGIGNQISGFVSSKMGGAAPAGGEPAEGEVPVQEGVPGENGEVPPEGGAMGFAKGLLGKAMAVKDGAMAKAGDLGAGNIGGVGNKAGGMMSQVTGLIPGMKREEEVPDVAPQEGEYQEYTEDGQYAEQYQGEYQQEYQQ